MSDNPLILGIGLGGVAIGTIFAAGYMFGVKQGTFFNKTGYEEEEEKEEEEEEEELDEEDEDEEKENNKPSQKEVYKKLPKVIKLLKDRERLEKELYKINNKLEDSAKISEEKEILIRRKNTILEKIEYMEKQIKSYSEHIIQLAKNKLAEEEDIEYKKNYKILKEADERKEAELNALANADAEEEGPSYEDYNSEDEDEDNTADDRLSLDRVSTSSTSSVNSTPIFGGAKKFILSYTPTKKSRTNKCKTNKHKNKKRKTKRNNI